MDRKTLKARAASLWCWTQLHGLDPQLLTVMKDAVASMREAAENGISDEDAGPWKPLPEVRLWQMRKDLPPILQQQWRRELYSPETAIETEWRDVPLVSES